MGCSLSNTPLKLRKLTMAKTQMNFYIQNLTKNLTPSEYREQFPKLIEFYTLMKEGEFSLFFKFFSNRIILSFSAYLLDKRS